MTASPLSSRRLEHASVDEVITFLELAAETGGARTLLECELGPGGGTPLHRHRAFDERFEVLDGELVIHRGGERIVLGPGEVAEIPRLVPHRFENGSAGPVRFRTELSPGQPGFERLQQVGFGLAGDGRVGRGGMPRDPRHVALMLSWSDTHLVGPGPSLLTPVLRLLAALARLTGEDRRLIERYVTF